MQSIWKHDTRDLMESARTIEELSSRLRALADKLDRARADGFQLDALVQRGVIWLRHPRDMPNPLEEAPRVRR